MINTVIFDIGKVLVDFCWEKRFHELGYEGERFEAIANATVRSPYWEEFDKGILTTEEVLEHYIALAPEYRKEISHLYDDSHKLMQLFDYSVDWILGLKQRGLKVYLLSNWSRPAFYDCKENGVFPFLEYVDGAVISYEEGIIKPQQEIYELICNRYQINPAEAVFIDDNAANILGAKEFGLHTIHFQSYEQAKKELEDFIL